MLNEPGPRSEGEPEMREDERYENHKIEARATAPGQSVTAEGCGEQAPTFNIHPSFFRRNIMSHLYNFFDNHGEVWGAVVFGLLTVAACIAMAAALNGAM
jgi:hypothetical protein